MCVCSHECIPVMIVIFLKCISFFKIKFFFLFNHYFYLDLVKAKPIRYCIELPV